jgi:hypothetical protein
MLQSAPMKQSFRYDQLSCRLQVEGLPDLAAGQGGSMLGIITGWTLEWVGRPQLEGRREHLQALIQVVLPYARHLISGVSRHFGSEQGPVEIGPGEEGRHHLLLRSSQPDTPPLELQLDDAELADLVRVLDQLRLDPRLQLSLPVPEPVPLRGRELMERLPLGRRLAAPLAGVAALTLAAGLGVLLPTPTPQPGRPSATSPQGTAPVREAPGSPRR